MKNLHSWHLTPSEAIELQKRLANSIITNGDPQARLIAGIDCSCSGRIFHKNIEQNMYAAIIVWDAAASTIVERAFAITPIVFPYIPGLLTFREGPAIIEAWQKLKIKPEAVIFDGHGKAHPRGMGIASHLGLWLDLPSIGCGKSRLCGEASEPALRAGSTSDLKSNGEIIGKLLRTRANTKPLYVSIGHRIALEAAVKLVLSCCRGYRLPEPTRLAHLAVNALRKATEQAKA